MCSLSQETNQFAKSLLLVSIQSQNSKVNVVAGATSIFAGSGQDWNADGVGTSASFCSPIGIAIDQQTGTIFVSDNGSNLIRKISFQGNQIPFNLWYLTLLK